MAIFLDLAIENGGSFHSFLYVYQRVTARAGWLKGKIIEVMEDVTNVSKVIVNHPHILPYMGGIDHGLLLFN